MAVICNLFSYSNMYFSSLPLELGYMRFWGNGTEIQHFSLVFKKFNYKNSHITQDLITDKMTNLLLFQRNCIFVKESFMILHLHYFMNWKFQSRVSYLNYSYSNYSSILRYSNLEYFWSNTRTIRVPKKSPFLLQFHVKNAKSQRFWLDFNHLFK